jgi:ribosome maturation factor RimP
LEEVFVTEIQQKIEDYLAPILESLKAFLVDIHIGFGDKRKIIQLFVDSDEGITIDACAEVSRKLGAILEVENVIDGPYVLEVSSPGASKPLKLLRQYPRNIGRKLKIRFNEESGLKEVVGILNSIQNESIVIVDEKNNHRQIEFQSIVESTVELPW